MTAFTMTQKVLFRHCDPARIVFFPRYFEMINDCVEAFFDEVLGWPFEAIHESAATPTAQIDTRFAAPSYHGDLLELRLKIIKVGRTSAQYQMTAHCAEELRFDACAVLVHVGLEGTPQPWPARISEILKDREVPQIGT